MNKNESRYFNTAKKIDDALVSLLEKKEYEFITIKDICKEAKVNRSTFYLHYENMNDLLEEVIENANKDFSSVFSVVQKKNPVFSNKEDLMFITDEYLIPYLTFVKDHKKLFQASKKNALLFKTDEIENNTYKNLISKILDKYEIEEKYKEYYFEYFVSGIQAIVMKWLNNDCDLKIQEAADLIKKLVKKSKNVFK